MIRRCRPAIATMLIGAAVVAASPQGLPVGSPAPAISADHWLNTKAPVTLAQLKGKVVLLDFWGVWCTPCRKEMPSLVELQLGFAQEGFVVLTIHTPQKTEEVSEYLRKHEIPLIVAIDTGETAAAYGVDAFPAYILVDRHGLVVSQPDHVPRPDAIRRLLEKRPVP